MAETIAESGSVKGFAEFGVRQQAAKPLPYSRMSTWELRY
jgi:hypothetical protein